jgi:hypothetical protein
MGFLEDYTKAFEQPLQIPPKQRLRPWMRRALAWAMLCASPVPAAAQIVEVAGSRALGMGGAFVAVADDSSATWWNPAGLAEGPFLDMALVRTETEVARDIPARRDTLTGFTLGTPPFGFSYYRLHFTEIAAADSTAQERASREDRRAGTVRSLAVSQLGATFIQTLLPGIHAATTLKYVRGTVRRSVHEAGTGESGVGELLDAGDDLEGGDGDGRFDLDAGVLVVRGPFRVGVAGRNLRKPVFGDVSLPRQVRVGVALDGDVVWGAPFMAAVDVDVRRYPTGTGDRRVIALGAERWFRTRQLGLRAGARFNTVGGHDRAATAGASWAVRPGLYVDGHAIYGGESGERGWGVAARVSF